MCSVVDRCVIRQRVFRKFSLQPEETSIELVPEHLAQTVLSSLPQAGVMMENALVVYVFHGTHVAVWTGQRNLGDEVIVVYEAMGVDAQAGSEVAVSYARRTKRI